MSVPKILIPAMRQYKYDDKSGGFVFVYDRKLTDQIVWDLQNEIIDLKACLRTCANAANGGLEQYKSK
tara:strand:+ start:543 stop:746 length:204 start_codon:yes stop_codon:yes gene_type:complete